MAKYDHIKDPTIRNAKKAEDILKDALTKANKEKQVNIRLTEEQYSEIERRMQKYKYSSMSEYFRFVALNAVIEVSVKEK